MSLKFSTKCVATEIYCKKCILKRYTELIGNSKDTETQYWSKGQITDQSAL